MSKNMFCPGPLDPDQLILIDALISLAMSNELSADELNVLGNSIVAVGSLILTKAAKLTAQQNRQDNRYQIQKLEEQIQRLEAKL